jgi:hypothetical protein
MIAGRAVQPQLPLRMPMAQHVKKQEPCERDEKAEKGHAFHEGSPQKGRRPPAPLAGAGATHLSHHHQKDHPVAVNRAVCADAISDAADRVPVGMIAVIR